MAPSGASCSFLEKRIQRFHSCEHPVRVFSGRILVSATPDIGLVADNSSFALSDFPELSGRNGKSGHSASESGTPNIDEIRAWVERPAATGQFRSPFALAYWDSENPNLIYAARDTVGRIPLFYCSLPSGFWLSTNLSWLLSSTPESLDLDWTRVMRTNLGLLDRGCVESDYAQIKRVPAGSILRASSKEGFDECTLRRYFCFSELGVEGGDALLSPDVATSKLHDCLSGAISGVLPSSGQIASELSGGLDSSAITGGLASLAPGRVKSFSAVFPTMSQSDESEFIDSVIENTGVENERFSAPSLSVGDAYTKSLKLIGGYHKAANVHVNLEILERLKSQQIRHLFNGVDGDNVISNGYGRMPALARKGKWQEFFSAVEEFGVVRGRSDPTFLKKLCFETYGREALNSRSSKARRLQYVRELFLIFRNTGVPLKRLARSAFGWRLLSGYRPTSSPRKASGAQELLQADFVENLGLAGASALTPDFAQMSELELQNHILCGGVTEKYFELIHPMARAHDVHIHSPFMNLDVMALGLSIPPEHKFHLGWNRWVLRKAMEREMGSKVAWRTWKSDLSWGLIPFAKRDLIPQLQDWVTSPNLLLWEIYNPIRVSALLKRLDGADDEQIKSNLVTLFSIWSLHVFLSSYKTWQPN